MISHNCTAVGNVTIIVKGSPDQNYYIFEINVGNRRIQNITTLNLNLQSILNRFRNPSFNFRVSITDPPLSDIDFNHKMAWVWTTLKPSIADGYLQYALTANLLIDPY